jgi:nitrogen regulatory protein PII
MKRITLILKTSEIMAVRKAACIAGADRIVARAISKRDRACFSSHEISADDEFLRLDVMVIDKNSDEVVSAIVKTARVGKIEKISQVNARHVLANLCLLAA